MATYSNNESTTPAPSSIESTLVCNKGKVGM